MRHLLGRIGLVVLAVALLNTSVATIPANGGQERQYLVAGKRNALPDRSAVVAAGGIWVEQITSIGVAVVRSSDPDFLTRVRSDVSVALASPDFEAVIPETELDTQAEADLATQQLPSHPRTCRRLATPSTTCSGHIGRWGSTRRRRKASPAKG